MRIALGIEYDGSAFSGWQIQKGEVNTVQTAIEKALTKIANEPISHCQVAGRTDTGVHATGQVIHFDTTQNRTMRSWVLGTNRYLSAKTVSVLWAHSVNDQFHARFSAQRRRYRYVILSRKIRPTFLHHLVSWESRVLELVRMQKAAEYLVGEHDFNSYRTVKCQAKSSIKTVYDLQVSQQGNYFYIDIEANSFLHHMVRNIAGVLLAIGAGEQPPLWAKEVLLAKDRNKGGKTAPPSGLYLSHIHYDKIFNLPQIESIITF
jgi:tRNA pseudouridine38-40 synthase